MKILLGIVFGAGLFLGATAFADEGTLTSRQFMVNNGQWGDNPVFKFVDPDNGNVCYMTPPYGYKGMSISCLKP